MKTENSMANSTFSDQIPASFPFPSSFFDMSYEVEKGSLGFLDLLGVPDYCPSLSDLLQTPLPPQSLITSPASSAPPESSEVVNAPATPNSSSISSSSTEAANDDQTKAPEEDDQDQEKNKKQ